MTIVKGFCDGVIDNDENVAFSEKYIRSTPLELVMVHILLRPSGTKIPIVKTNKPGLSPN